MTLAGMLIGDPKIEYERGNDDVDPEYYLWWLRPIYDRPLLTRVLARPDISCIFNIF